MKKITLATVALAVLTSSTFAGEYGFRDFLLDHQQNFMALDENRTGYVSRSLLNIATYCDIQGGDIIREFKNDLGSQTLKLHTDEDEQQILSMSKEERLTKYGKSGDYDRKLNRSFVDADNGDGHNGVYECKLPDGQKIFSATQGFGNWVVKHNKEQIVDRVFYATYVGNKDANLMGYTTRKGKSTDIKAKLGTEYPTYESFFDDWQNGFLSKDKKTKQGQNYKFYETFMFDNSFQLQNSMGELTETQYFCEAKHGDFYKDGKPYREFIKDIYEKGTAYEHNTFKGTYACVNTPEAFTLTLDRYTVKQGMPGKFFMDKAIMKKGASKDDLKVPVVTENKISDFDIFLLDSALYLKRPVSKQNGLTVETAVYDGKDAQGCDLLYLEKHITTIPNSSKTFNYRSCHGNITVRQ